LKSPTHAGIADGKSVNYDADHGDRWRRSIDHSDGSTIYERRTEEIDDE
jgi:hypothetical protein